MARRIGRSPNGSREEPLRRASAQDGELRFTAAEQAHAARIVDLLGPVIPALASALAPRTEVVLHDLTRMPNTIAAIGGSITGRSVGGPPTDLGLRVFRAGWREHLLRYRTETSDGLVMRSSSLFFRAPSGNPVACLCINTDINDLARAQEVLTALTATSIADPLGENSSPDGNESFPTSVDTLVEGILSDAVAAVGVAIPLMKKSHKIEVVRELERRGFFTIREAADIAAKRLGVSRYTVYNYLNEIDARRSEAPR